MILRNFIILFLSVTFCTSIFAQSDYRITQEFKSRQRAFEIAIDYAKTVGELNKIKREISEFKNEFKGHKELLNSALYPSNFEDSFVTLNKKIEFANKKLTQIQGLESKVTKLEEDFTKVTDELRRMVKEVNSLKTSNRNLMNQLSAFKSGYGGSKSELDSLKNLVAELKSGISKRDTLIKEIMDNIFMSADNKLKSLNDAEDITLKTKIQGTGLIDNISSLVNDNIAFLNATIFTPSDLKSLSDEFNEFQERWTHFGPKLFDIYAADKQNKDKLNDIDSLINNWDYSINLAAWKGVRKDFIENNIKLDEFTNGKEFEDVVISYIDRQIKNPDDLEEVSRDQTYTFFAERAWKDKVKSNWMPFLISNELISTQQITSIENKLAEWKDSTSGSRSYLIYSIIILLAIIIIISLYLVNKTKKQKTVELDLSADKDDSSINDEGKN